MSKIPAVRIWDYSLSTQNPRAYLQNAFDVKYEKKVEAAWTASFSLPADDPKNEYCKPYVFVEIYDGNERVELFRISPITFRKVTGSKILTYSCEHVLMTLYDDMMFQYHDTSNLSPRDTLEYILGYQSQTRWVVGDVDFEDFYSYKFENSRLLGCVYSVPKLYNEEYLWTFDTTSYPWKLNLVSPPAEVSGVLAYRKNLLEIEKVILPTNLITRVYPLGYGEGDNQLTIKEANGGVPYLDSDTVSLYGVIAAPFVDLTEENPEMLKAKGRAFLEANKVPEVSYTATAADMYKITRSNSDNFRQLGKLIKVMDPDVGTFNARIVNVSKSDVTGRPGEIQIEIANKRMTIYDTTLETEKRLQTIEKYAQGATNLDSDSYQDNCDSTHPAVVEFFVPEECVRVNKCLLTYKTSRFRAYERATLGGGAAAITSEGGGDHRHKMFVYDGNDMSDDYDTSISGVMEPHSHTYKMAHSPISYRALLDPTPGSILYGIVGMPNDGASEDIYTYESSGVHTHPITLPDHDHAIDYGIYENNSLPSSIVVKVDGTVVPGLTGLTGNSIDIIPYLAKDSSGKVTRSTFHTVEVTPNDLARITVNVTKQIFVQSRGGGDY